VTSSWRKAAADVLMSRNDIAPLGNALKAELANPLSGHRLRAGF
jgi:hypothetical protein